MSKEKRARKAKNAVVDVIVNQAPVQEAQPQVPAEAPQPSPKENARQAVALCHHLIANGQYNIQQFQQVPLALNYLETVFKQLTAEIESEKTEASNA